MKNGPSARFATPKFIFSYPIGYEKSGLRPDFCHRLFFIPYDIVSFFLVSDLARFFLPHDQSVDRFTTNLSFLLYDPGNESQRSRGFKTLSENRIGQEVVAEIMDERSGWQLQKVYQNRIPLNLQRPCVKKSPPKQVKNTDEKMKLYYCIYISCWVGSLRTANESVKQSCSPEWI